MNVIRKSILWVAFLQILTLSAGVALLAVNARWRSRLAESALVIERSDTVLKTITASGNGTPDSGESRQAIRALSQFGNNAVLSLKAENTASRTFTQATDAIVWIMIGAEVFSLCLVARVIGCFRKAQGMA